MSAKLTRIILGSFLLAACTQDPNMDNNKQQSSTTAGGYADIQRYFATGTTAQCPGGYDIITSFQISTCTNVFPPGGYSTCTVTYCGLKFAGQPYIVTDFKFFNHTETGVAPACPPTYQDLPDNDPNGYYWPTNASYQNDDVTKICIQYQNAGSNSAPITKFYINDAGCASNETTFQGYRYQPDTTTVSTDYCYTH
jgi:hypothetical protein